MKPDHSELPKLRTDSAPSTAHTDSSRPLFTFSCTLSLMWMFSRPPMLSRRLSMPSFFFPFALGFSSQSSPWLSVSYTHLTLPTILRV